MNGWDAEPLPWEDLPGVPVEDAGAIVAGRIGADLDIALDSDSPERNLFRAIIISAVNALAFPNVLARELRMTPDQLRAMERRYFCSDIFCTHAAYAGIDPDTFRLCLHRYGLLYGHDLREADECKSRDIYGWLSLNFR